MNIEKKTDCFLTEKEECIREEEIYDKILCAKTVEETEATMSELYELETSSNNQRTFQKIERCFDIASNPKKALEIRLAVINFTNVKLFKVLNDNIREGNLITQDQARFLINNIKPLLRNPRLEKEMKDEIFKTFVEISTINLIL